jgi:hypothetical protein
VSAKKLRIIALCAVVLLPFGFVFLERLTGFHSHLVEMVVNLGSAAAALLAMAIQPIGRLLRLYLIGLFVLVLGTIITRGSGGGPACAAFLVFALFVTDGDTLLPESKLGRVLLPLAVGGLVVCVLATGAFFYLFYDRRTPDPAEGRVIEFICCKGSRRLFLAPFEHWFIARHTMIFMVGWTMMVVFGVVLPVIDKGRTWSQLTTHASGGAGRRTQSGD